MPKIPEDMTKARARDARIMCERAEAAKQKERQRANMEKAMKEMRDKFAAEHGVDPNEVTIIVCNRGRS